MKKVYLLVLMLVGLGLFMMPLHPARPVADTYEEDLHKLILADKLGRDAGYTQTMAAKCKGLAAA